MNATVVVELKMHEKLLLFNNKNPSKVTTHSMCFHKCNANANPTLSCQRKGGTWPSNIS